MSYRDDFTWDCSAFLWNLKSKLSSSLLTALENVTYFWHVLGGKLTAYSLCNTHMVNLMSVKFMSVYLDGGLCI
jgi:hypothetical protein